MAKTLKELLEEAQAAGDLRRQETVRLINAAKEVSEAIGRVAKEINCYASVVEEIPANNEEMVLKELRVYRDGDLELWQAKCLASDFDEIWGEERIIFASARPETETERISRSQWIWVAEHLPLLAEELVAVATDAAVETQKAAELAERLKSALKEE